MTQYMLSVYMVEGAELPAPEAMQKMFHDVDVLNQKIQDKGAWVFGGGLHPANTATVVRENSRRVEGAAGWFLDHRGCRPRRRAGVGRRGHGCLPGTRRSPPLPGQLTGV